MIEHFLLPDLGEGLPEAEIVQWHVAEGDAVALNQTIAEVETAKAIVEIPSPYAGTVQGLHAAAGEVVAVGSPLVSFAVEGADAGTPAARAPEPSGERVPESAVQTPADDASARATPNLVGYGAAPSSGSRPRRRARRTVPPTLDGDHAVRVAAPHDVLHAGAVEPPPERPRSTPPVRKLAKDLGVDLTLVAAAHPGETVTRAHVEGFAGHHVRPAAPTSPVPPREGGFSSDTPSSASAVLPAAPAPGDPRVTRTPVRGVRKHTAAAMVRSAFTAPHATTFLTLDVTATTELLASLSRDRALDGHRIGVLALVAKAVCLALGRTPALNAAWDDAAGEIVEHHFVNLGIAAATDRGLLVPVVPDADRLALVDLADAIAELAATARAGRTTPAAMTGGTFTITNVGVFGVDAGTPILTPGEAGILAVGAVRRTPWEHHGEIALRDVVTLSLSFDHRLVDGAEAARFLSDVAGVLREPGRAMLLR
ncbi:MULTISPECIES: dihydrolipoamide acetyltransferase family protein [Microbacterium]|uniref:dihydrolipoamide acetyltransferase family protein n=1 Tax=Microbacterium TaxID=33882 RepID=UPI0027812101|nr:MULTISPECIES: dihydrolipoamide acetyltransferase family protein [Microbacterium]MDQ1084346.1 2-oxoisovalerate dehydrogenase E2 component (dihydrolipoyl transacylase) [Microbacterium sp. SORGH_AS_0344]MDQ1170378.1 2-oxoisovalerate dehydrogenase E2 component (dihydrolipoyl transacylase) [Microbacterium proteolyticum]